tara:strand:- start:556 stop:1011 length:456 start_codon:yes stop_codon:yes gene_type:complete
MGGIRKIERHEIPGLVPCARMFSAEASLPGVFNADAFVGTLVALFDGGKWICFVVMNEDGVTIDGTIAGIIYPDVTTGDSVCTEMFWFVKPENRGSMSSIKLLDSLESEAKRRGCARLAMTRICGMNDEKLADLYARRGLREFEINYIKDL